MGNENETPQKTLAELRAERNESREELAVAVDASYSTITNIELGRNKPQIDLAERIYKHYGVPVGSIRWLNKKDTVRRPKADATLVA